MRFFLLCILLVFSSALYNVYGRNIAIENKLKYVQKMRLANVFENGIGVHKNEEKAFSYYYEAIFNDGYTEDKPLEYLKRKAEEGNTYAEYYLGRYYGNYEKIRGDSKLSFYWHSKAAEKNYPPAVFQVGRSYLYGDGVDKDPVKGKEVLLKSFELGLKTAQGYLAYLYINDDTGAFETSYKEAFKWFSESAKNGDLDSMYDMGVCYFHGLGVAEDKAKAVEIWRSMLDEVVEDKLPGIKSKVCLALARCYHYGLGIEKDRDKVVAVLGVWLLGVSDTDLSERSYKRFVTDWNYNGFMPFSFQPIFP